MSQAATAHDDVEAYVLGALDNPEYVAFERHLAGCGSCRTDVSSYVPVIGGLAQIPTTLPPAAPVVQPRGLPGLRGRFGRVAALATAAALLIGIGMGTAVLRRPTTDFQLMAIAGMLADGPRTVALHGATPARGRVIVGHRQQRTAIVVRDLPAAPQGEAYHVWISGSADRLIGTLVPAREHLSVLLVDGNLLTGTHRLAVSLEANDPPAHPGTPVLVADV